jgi:hypothetical protein
MVDSAMDPRRPPTTASIQPHQYPHPLTQRTRSHLLGSPRKIGLGNGNAAISLIAEMARLGLGMQNKGARTRYEKSSNVSYELDDDNLYVVLRVEDPDIEQDYTHGQNAHFAAVYCASW